MRICLYTETALPKIGGQELVVDALARQYQELGHQVVVLAPCPRRPLRTQDACLPYPVVRHLRFFSTRWFVSFYRSSLLRLYRQRPFDVLHCHGLYPSGYLAALCRDRLGVPIVLTSHGGDVREGNIRLNRPVLLRRHLQALRAADALVAISRFTRDNYRRLFPEARRVVDIPNGVDLAPFAERVGRPAELDPGIRSKRYFLFLGRLKKRKGVDLLLEATARLARASNQVQVVIAGPGEERPALEEQGRRLGLGERIRFVGSATGAAKTFLVQNALAVVMPSRQWEAFPLVILESYAAGTPVIGARVPGLDDLVSPNQTGWQVPAESPDELARAMQAAWDDPIQTAVLGERARAMAQAYSWRAIALRHLTLYEKLRSEKASPFSQPA
jgi:glycosyltransferase involved in cell wall biosynthesis